MARRTKVGTALATVAIAAVIAGPTAARAYEDDIVCDTTDASPPGHISITGLRSASPTMVWTDGYAERLEKVYESPKLIVLQRVTGGGQYDIVYVDLIGKQLTIVLVGAYAAKEVTVEVNTVHAGMR